MGVVGGERRADFTKPGRGRRPWTVSRGGERAWITFYHGVPARVTSESERDFTGAWADKWDSRHFFAGHPTFLQPCRERCKISPPSPLPTFDITPRFIYLRSPLSDKIYRNWKYNRYHALSFSFFTNFSFLSPPFLYRLWAIRPPPLLSNNRLHFLLVRLFAVPLPKLFHFRDRKIEREREREIRASQRISRACANDISPSLEQRSSPSVIPLVFFRNEREAVRSCKQFNINRPCFEFNGNERIR